MLCLVLIGTIILYFYFAIKKKQSLWKNKTVKYVNPTFLLGNFSIFPKKSFAECVQDLYNFYPEEKFIGIYLFLQPTLIIKDPNLIKQITIKSFEHFVDHRQFIDADTDQYWGRNLFASEGQRWRDLRSTLSPSFTSGKMRILYILIDECAQQFVQHFKSENQSIIEIEIKDAFTRYTNDVIASTAFGLKCDSLDNRSNKFYMLGKQIANLGGGRNILKFFVSAISPTISKFLKIKIIPTHLANYFSKILADTIKMREENNIVRPDMIQLLMQAQAAQDQEQDPKVDEGFSSVIESDLTRNKRQNGKITLEDITAQAFLFFLAGFESVATLLTFAFYELATNPTIQERLRAELLELEDNLTYENLLKLKYLDMVVSETLRKWPPVIFTDRKVTKAFTIQPEKPWQKPVHLEEGLICWVPIFALHNDPKFWPEPEKFDPERFNDINKKQINSSVYVPFGAGPRNCIASRFTLLETKLILFHMLTHFEIIPVEKTQSTVVLDVDQFNLGPKGGIWLGLKKL